MHLAMVRLKMGLKNQYVRAGVASYDHSTKTAGFYYGDGSVENTTLLRHPVNSPVS
ncbi:hypothetical protein MEG_00232 [Bartonella tamiae Th307]|uniref:Uncharacterized protein n=2 Tax=Bartonella tamiae TaxID=373638 RepID=J0R0Q3_9HYPH|nr:hypothetical protein ME5_01650 [Bartonella tamiae Th239]EJF94651.1 hypothetical protein MEG_00232 [Bartonella tamiae Th307]